MQAIVRSLVILSALTAWSATAAENLRLTLPPHSFAVVGQPFSVYFDNLVLTQTPEQYRFEVKLEREGKATSGGMHEPRRWTFMPEASHVGQHVLRVEVFDRQNQSLGTASSALHVVAADAGADRKLTLLIVGDSLTYATQYPNQLAKLLSKPGNPAWKMLGTHRPTVAAEGVVHEGYSGWTWQAFASLYLEKPGLDKRRRISPFVFADDRGKPQLDPSRYFDEHFEGQRPDAITILLGINDCFSAPADDPVKTDERIDAMFKQAEKLLAAMRQAAPNADLAFCLTPPPNVREEAFASNYKNDYTRWGWKRIQHRLVEREIKQFAGREGERIFLMPTELNVDPVDGYPVNNAVHPNVVGYGQIADALYAWLKWRLSARSQRE